MAVPRYDGRRSRKSMPAIGTRWYRLDIRDPFRRQTGTVTSIPRPVTRAPNRDSDLICKAGTVTLMPSIRDSGQIGTVTLLPRPWTPLAPAQASPRESLECRHERPAAGRSAGAAVRAQRFDGLGVIVRGEVGTPVADPVEHGFHLDYRVAPTSKMGPRALSPGRLVGSRVELVAV